MITQHRRRARSPASADFVATRPSARGRCRTNSRHGLDRSRRTARIRRSSRCAARSTCCAPSTSCASPRCTAIHEETGFPKPTIVRHARDAARRRLRRARQHVRRLSRDLARAEAQFRLPGHLADHRGRAAARDRAHAAASSGRSASACIDGDAIAIKFWTGAISPWAHTNTVLGLRPDLLTTAMGRAYLAFCPDEEREAPSRPTARRSAAAISAKRRSADSGRSSSRCAATATRRAIRGPSRSARPRWRCRSARARPCTR